MTGTLLQGSIPQCPEGRAFWCVQHNGCTLGDGSGEWDMPVTKRQHRLVPVTGVTGRSRYVKTKEAHGGAGASGEGGRTMNRRSV